MRRLVSVTLLVVIAAACGCDSGLKRVPVSGTATLDGQPFSGGVIHFYPDDTKGNPNKVDCLSPVRDGKFNLLTTAIRDTDSGSGAPLGAYKVYLYTDIPGVMLNVHPKYTDPMKTPLTVEVVEKTSAGAYEIKFLSK
jgi:hypothetical protein